MSEIKASAELMSPRELTCERVSERFALRLCSLRGAAVRYDLYERPDTNIQPETEYGGDDMKHHDGLPCDPQDLEGMAADQADWDGGDDEVAADREGWDEVDDDSEELDGQLSLFASPQPDQVQERDPAQHQYEPIVHEEDGDGLPFRRSDWK